MNFRNRKPIPVAIRVNLEFKDGKEEPASQEIFVESKQEASTEKPGEADFKVTEETPVITHTLTAPAPILEFPVKSMAEVTFQTLKFTSLPATEANVKLVGNIMELSPQVRIMDSIPKRSTEALVKLESVFDKENSVAEFKKEHLAPVPGPKVVDTETASQPATETPNPLVSKENLNLEEDTEASGSPLAIVASTPKPLQRNQPSWILSSSQKHRTLSKI